MTCLDLSDNGLGTEGAIAIATMMKENCYITQLVSCVCRQEYFPTSHQCVMVGGAAALLEMLYPWNSHKMLTFSYYLYSTLRFVFSQDLSDNNMGAPAAYVIAPLASINSTLVHLSLRGNKFGDKAVEPLAELLRGSYHIKFLDLSHNEFGEEAGIILGPAIGVYVQTRVYIVHVGVQSLYPYIYTVPCPLLWYWFVLS